jgi:hypothetical protein
MSFRISNTAVPEALSRTIKPAAQESVVSTFTYAAGTTTALTMTNFLGVDVIVVTGTIPAANTVITMPTHLELLGLFVQPQEHDIREISMITVSANSIDLTQTNPATSSPVTIPGLTITQLYLKVVNATETDGIANVKITGHVIGGSSSPAPIQVTGQTSAANVLTALGMIPTLGAPNQWQYPLGTLAATIRTDTIADIIERNKGAIDGVPFTMLSPIVVVNTSGVTKTWTAVSGSQTFVGDTAIQPNNASYAATMTITPAGSTPTWVGSTMVIQLKNISV